MSIPQLPNHLPMEEDNEEPREGRVCGIFKTSVHGSEGCGQRFWHIAGEPFFYNLCKMINIINIFFFICSWFWYLYFSFTPKIERPFCTSVYTALPSFRTDLLSWYYFLLSKYRSFVHFFAGPSAGMCWKATMAIWVCLLLDGISDQKLTERSPPSLQGKVTAFVPLIKSNK